MRNAILPLFAAVVIGKEPWVAGTALAVFAAGNAVGLTVSGRLSDRVGRRPFIVGGLVISGLATIVTGFASDLPVLVVLSVVAGLGAGMLNPAQQAALADIVGRERNGGPALATFQMSADSGAIVGPILAGLLIDHGSYPLAFGITGLITLLAVVPWLFARETHDVRARGAHARMSGVQVADVADVEATVAEHSRGRPPRLGATRRPEAYLTRMPAAQGGARRPGRPAPRSRPGPSTGSRPVTTSMHGLGGRELLAALARGPLRGVLLGRPVADALGVEPDRPAGRHRPRQVVALRHDEHPVDPEDPLGPGARVVGVAAREVAHDGIRRNALAPTSQSRMAVGSSWFATRLSPETRMTRARPES